MIGWCAGLAGCRAAGLNLRRRVLDGSPRGAAASVTQRRVVGLVRPVGELPRGDGDNDPTGVVGHFIQDLTIERLESSQRRHGLGHLPRFLRLREHADPRA